MTQRFRNEEWPQITEAILAGCWWLLREIELASLKGAFYSFSGGLGCGRAEVTIRANKADTEGAGCRREDACICPSDICPVKAARALAQRQSTSNGPLDANNGRTASGRCRPLHGTNQGFWQMGQHVQHGQIYTRGTHPPRCHCGSTDQAARYQWYLAHLPIRVVRQAAIGVTAMLPQMQDKHKHHAINEYMVQ